jgi:serine/threonine protein kinase
LDYYDPTDPEEEAKAEARFETEARLLAELSHPGVPRIYSYFSENGRHYIVMEYIEGETLERAVTHTSPLGRELPARPLSIEQVVRHAIRVCRVLEYLAERPTPIVHHDIKPANLIVDKTSAEVRLVDFGTAEARIRWATKARLGQAVSSLFGTEGYAAPEQYQGLSDPRSDVYSLASTMYHLMTDDDPSQHPFHFPELGALPGPIADALNRALRPEVNRRSTALEFRQALQAWLIPDDAGQPFVFGGGAVANTAEELVSLCDQNWAEARVHLESGDFDQWFRSRNRHDLVSKAKSARLEGDPDAALEAFLRRLDPRLEAPRLAIEPREIDFGSVSRQKPANETLTIHNESRGYGRASLSSSVPWLQIHPDQVGCLAGDRVQVSVSLDASGLPLRREQNAILAATPNRGVRLSIPVTARLSLAQEVAQRLFAGLKAVLHLSRRGAKHGFALWTRTFRSLIRSRFGPWVLLAEGVLLAAVMVALYWSWQELPIEFLRVVGAFVQSLPLALLAVYLLPALAFIGGAIVWEAVQVIRVRR